MKTTAGLVVFVLLGVILEGYTCPGQDPDFVLTAASVDGVVGDSVPIPVLLSHPDAVAGVSYGLCHDLLHVSVDCTGGIPNDCIDKGIIVQGSALAATNGGAGAGFFAPATATDPNVGYTCGIVVNLLGADSLPPSRGSELVVATYRCLLETPDNAPTPLVFCETGEPLVLVSVGLAGGGDLVPTTESGSIAIAGAPPAYTLVQGSNNDCVVSEQAQIPTTLVFNQDPVAPDVAGVSYGVCHDTAFLNVGCMGGIPNDCIDNGIIVQGADLQATNGGDGAAFFAPATTDTPLTGYTVGIVVDLLGSAVLPNTGTAEVVIATYDCLALGTSGLDFCETGDPTVLISVGIAGGGDTVPATQSGKITVVELTPAFTFSAPGDALIVYDPATGEGAGDVGLRLREVPVDGLPFPSDTQGFSYGLRHGEELSIEDAGIPPVLDRGIRPAPILQALNGGLGPEFFGPNVAPSGGPGHTLGVVYALMGGPVVQYPSAIDIVLVTYRTRPESVQGEPGPLNVPLTWAPADDPLGDPPVLPRVVVPPFGDTGVQFEDGRVTLQGGVDFLRGDCNDDGIVNIADAVWTLNALFANGPEGTCAEACDANRDGRRDSSDAIFTLDFQFLGGPPPSAPYPECGNVGPGQDCDAVTNNECG